MNDDVYLKKCPPASWHVVLPSPCQQVCQHAFILKIPKIRTTKPFRVTIKTFRTHVQKTERPVEPVTARHFAQPYVPERSSTCFDYFSDCSPIIKNISSLNKGVWTKTAVKSINKRPRASFHDRHLFPCQQSIFSNHLLEVAAQEQNKRCHHNANTMCTAHSGPAMLVQAKHFLRTCVPAAA